jgi:hypothetical protein
MMNVGLNHRGIDPQLGAVFQTKPDRSLNLFQRRHFLWLAEELRREGHYVGELDFRIGDKPLDRFIDIPPYAHDWPKPLAFEWRDTPAHLKISIDGFASTCFGLIIRKAG